MGLEDPAEKKKAVHNVEHQHQCLSVFELKGFVGCKVDMELVHYILKNAMSLQKIIITYVTIGIPRRNCRLSLVPGNLKQDFLLGWS